MVGGAPSNFTADHQYLRTGSGMRSGLLRERRARHEDRRRGEQQLRLRRNQRLAGVPQDLALPINLKTTFSHG